MKEIIFLLLLVTILLQGCTQTINNVTADSLTENANSQQLIETEIKITGDSTLEAVNTFNAYSETAESNSETTESDSAIMQELIKNAPAAYWYWDDYEKQGAIVKGSDRRAIEEERKVESKSRWKLGRTRWNSRTGEYWLYNRTMPWELLERNNITRTSLNDNVNVYVKIISAQRLIVISPIDWMKEYQFDEPLKVFTSVSSIMMPLSKKDFTSSLALQFNNKKAQGIIIFYFEDKMKVPIRIEERTIYGNVTRTFEFNTDARFSAFNVQEITAEFFELTENDLLVTTEKLKEIESSVMHRRG